MQNQLSAPQANLKITLWNAEAEKMDSAELYLQLQDFGLPEEVTSRLHELIEVTKKVTGKVFAVGKIIVMKIIKFIKSHPFLAAGASIAAVLSMVVTGFITAIPILGPMLTPVAITLGVSVTVTGAVIGHRIDEHFNKAGQSFQEVEELVKKFFAMLISVFESKFSNAVAA